MRDKQKQPNYAYGTKRLNKWRKLSYRLKANNIGH